MALLPVGLGHDQVEQVRDPPADVVSQATDPVAERIGQADIAIIEPGGQARFFRLALEQFREPRGESLRPGPSS